MHTSASVTLMKMLESLPENVQERAMDHFREYLADLIDELAWDAEVEKTRPQLVEYARQARQSIAEGKAQPLDYDRL